MKKAYAIVLTMPKEIEVTKLSLLSMTDARKQFSHGDLEIHVMLNGPHDKNFENWCLQHEVIYKCAEKNLGVAGGRNFLIKSLQDDDAYIFILDNDIFIPLDYFSKMLMEFESLKAEKVGVLGATVLEYRQYKEHIKKQFTNAELKKISMKLTSFKDSVYHCGIHENWGYSYFLQGDLPEWSSHTSRGKDSFRSFAEFFAGRKFIPTSNVIGASQLFTLSLFKKLGGLKNTFNPYGYEDVDFSIKAIKAGLRNFVATETFILHGTDERHAQRITSTGIVTKITNDYRSAFHLFLEHADDPEKQFMKFLYFQLKSGRILFPHIFFAKLGMKKAKKESLEV